VSFHPDQKAIVSAGQDGTVRVWDVSSEGGQSASHKDSVNDLAFTPDSRFLLSCSRDRTLMLWYCVDMIGVLPIRGHEKGVNGCAIVKYSYGGNRSVEDNLIAASVSDDTTVRIWSVTITRGSSATYQLLSILYAHRGAIKSIAVSPLQDSFYTGGWDSQIFKWKIPEKSYDKQIIPSTFPINHTDWVNSVAVSSSGNVASASHDGTVRTTGTTMSNHSNWVLSCAFSPDARFIASASYDGTLVVCTFDGKFLRRYEGHSGRVNKCCFLEKNVLLSVSSDHFVFAWDVQSGKRLAEFECKGPATAIQVSPSGNGQFVVGDSLGNVEFLQLILPSS